MKIEVFYGITNEVNKNEYEKNQRSEHRFRSVSYSGFCTRGRNRTGTPERTGF